MSALTIWDRPNYLPIRQCPIITSLKKNQPFQGNIRRCNYCFLLSAVHLGLWSFWACLIPGPMLMPWDLSIKFNCFDVDLFLVLPRRSFYLFWLLWLLIIESFLPQPCWILAPGVSQGPAILKQKRLTLASWSPKGWSRIWNL